MIILEGLLLFYERFVLVYFAVLTLLYAYFGYLGIRSVVVYARELSPVALKDLLTRDIFKPVSILVPAYNEERTIVASVRSLLSLHFPQFEVIVVNDGATDATLARLTDAFALIEVPTVYRRVVPTAPVLRIFRSLRHPNLVVMDKENGGTPDALNTALNMAQYPLVCAIDADTLLDSEAVLRASRLFAEDDTVVGVGGTIRPLNNAVVREGQVLEVRLPRRWIERFQVLEYARAFFIGRAAWSQLSALMLISGAFSIFRRDAVLAVGGFWTETVSQDLELVFRLHKHHRRTGEPARMVFTPDPIAWTEVPSDMATLRRQRNRWQRGLWETLWHHRDMLFNPRYGRLGLVGVPYFWIFEAMAPAVELGGYVALVLSAIFDTLFAHFATLFVLLAVLYGVLFSQFAAGVETFLLARYPRLRDRMALLAASFLEFVGHRQVLVVERFLAGFQVRSKRGKWGVMRREGIATASEEEPAEPAVKPVAPDAGAPGASR